MTTLAPPTAATMFVRNRWYVAAWGTEIDEGLLQRWILGEPVLLYRTSEGRPVALGDRCPHRKYPLSRGKQVGDNVQCGYHGFTFGPDGACVKVPGQDHVPSKADVCSYPLVERWRWLWIWMGEADHADESLIPDHQGWLKLQDPDWHPLAGTRMQVQGRYTLLNDNLLDLSHLTFMHPESLGTDDIAEAPLTTDVDERSVRVQRDMRAVACPTFFQKAMGLESPIDRQQVAEFVPPGYHVTHMRAAPAGGGDDVACRHLAIHMVTPERDDTAHYFWALTRTYARKEDWVDDALRESIRQIFQQDVEAIEAQEEMLATEGGDAFEVSVKLDAGGLHGRRLLQELLDQERLDRETGGRTPVTG
jgi:vanillate O-demethylase monooxygenase subunit